MGTDLLGLIKRRGLRFFTGVPDSTLQAFCWAVSEDTSIEHVPAASEGSAVSLAIGSWIATGRVPCVYMQNSGLTNALGPLLALASPNVFDVPILLVIGWRGQPGVADEPQHEEIGRNTIPLLRMIGIEPFIVNVFDEQGIDDYIGSIVRGGESVKRGALLVGTSGLSSPSPRQHSEGPPSGLPKNAVLETVLDIAGDNAVIVAGIGHTSRQVMALRARRGEEPQSDLLCVGGMGFASHVALGLACSSPGKRVYCLDGDGSFLMHGCGNSVVGRRPHLPLTHLLLNNGCHASVGGHPVCNASVNFSALALSLGYPYATRVDSTQQLRAAMTALAASNCAGVIDVPICPGHDNDLPRPSKSLQEVVQSFRAKAGYV